MLTSQEGLQNGVQSQRAFDIKYMPRISVKGQFLVDLMTKFAESPAEEEMKKQGMDKKLVNMVSSWEPLS